MAETETAQSLEPQEAQETQESVEIQDSDRDALHILPLSILPIETAALHRMCLIKNAALEGVVEIFKGDNTGSGQVDVDHLQKEFGWEPTPPHPDMTLLHQLADLPSYDVYSLRILLRELKIPIAEPSALSLSESKKLELTEYMKEFTRPLIVRIYGGKDKTITDFDNIVTLLRDPDVDKAREKLQIMADQLKIKIDEVPKFLEDYGDIYLSLAYFKKCLDDYQKIINSFLVGLDQLRTDTRFEDDKNFVDTCNLMNLTINHVISANKHRFEHFDSITKDMWVDVTAEKFHQVESIIRSNHTTIGGGICALSVKMSAWSRLFPSKKSGGPIARYKYIMSEMRQGFDTILELERQAPPLPETMLDVDKSIEESPSGN